VQTGGLLQELDPVAVWQVQVGGYQRDVLAVASQHLKLGDTVRRRACGQYSIIDPNRRSNADTVVPTSPGSPPTISITGAGAVMVRPSSQRYPSVAVRDSTAWAGRPHETRAGQVGHPLLTGWLTAGSIHDAAASQREVRGRPAE